MVCASPDLKSLELDFRDLTQDLLKWSPEQLFSNIPITFSNLCVLRALGAVEIDWESFFEDLESNAFSSFLQRHRKLHTVSIGWIYESSWHNIKGEVLAGNLPFLRHFEGPVFICRALAGSSIAGQLESLSILDERWEDGNTMSCFADVAVQMPKLRSLSFGLQTEELDGYSLRTLLSLTPALTELAVWFINSDLVSPLRTSWSFSC
jgi:hypothetical protein